jgi:lipopolysaccharide transport protein LptA
VIRRARCPIFFALLCAPAALAEPGQRELDRLEGGAAKLEQALPDSAQGELRAAADRVADAVGGSGEGPFSLGGFDRSAPVVIRADELEATERDGRRVLVFRRNVEVSQAGLQLRAARLSAVYPAGAKQPSRLEADGGVAVREGNREARCERVVYDRLGRQLDCFGQAALRGGTDRVAGDSIRFDLARRSVSVNGGTEVWFEPRALREGEPGEAGLPAGLPLLREQAPAHVRAALLEASEDESGRRVTFEGDVELSQQGTTLRAQRLEAVYPPDGDQPDRLFAIGEVSLAEGVREARCERAEYLRLENRVLCEGGVARAGEDRLEGDVIDFALGEQKLSVRGRTRLVLGPREPGSATP